MKAERILTAPFEFVQIIKCEIQKAVNEHGFAILKGYISPDREEQYLLMAGEQTEVTIRAVEDEKESRQIYCGIVEDMKIIHENALCLMELRIVPYTYLMDLKPVRRSFQLPSMTYQEVLDCVVGQYQSGHALTNIGVGTAIGEPIVQYQETDWEFVKRLASHFHGVVVPGYASSGVKLYFGLVEWGGAAQMSPSAYRVQKRMDEFLYKKQNRVEGLMEDDSLVFIVEDQELYEAGELVEMNGRTLYVERSESRLDGHQLWNTYCLRTKGGLQVPRQYNERVIGASLDGRVTRVCADMVQISLKADAKGGSGKWFPFSTVYSSPDGSGWYCMPEPGDEIRLYFPTEQEKHAYVISSVHLPVTAQTSSSGQQPAAAGASASPQQTAANNGKAAELNPGVCRCDPTHKTIYTSSKKMVDLSEHSILLDAGNGMRILLDDTAGISIESHLGVSIKSDSFIDISSLNETVEIAGASGVNIIQKESSIEISESNVVYHNANVKAQ